MTICIRELFIQNNKKNNKYYCKLNLMNVTKNVVLGTLFFFFESTVKID